VIKLFDQKINRSKEKSIKYDELEKRFGNSELLSMWVADMDFLVEPRISKAIEQRASQHIYGYTTRPKEYFEAVCNWYSRRHNINLNKDNLLHSPGVVTSLSIAVRELTQIGDGVIIQTPVYPPFFDVIRLNNRTILENKLIENDGHYEIDFDDLHKKAKLAKMLIISNPHNPVGRVWSYEELEKINEIALEFNIIIVSDEIHGDITFEKKYTPFNMINQNAITLISATKPFNLAGLQASFIYSEQNSYLLKLQSMLNILDLKNNNCFSIFGIQAAYEYGDNWLDEMLKYVRKNMDYVNNFCKENIPMIKPNMPQGTYLVWIDMRNLGLYGTDLERFMLEEVKIAVNMGISFGQMGDGYIRMNLATNKETVEIAMDRLKEAINKRVINI
jgi:cystathionine beta-lyase